MHLSSGRGCGKVELLRGSVSTIIDVRDEMISYFISAGIISPAIGAWPRDMPRDSFDKALPREERKVE
jgi:hypothetical protein